MNICFLTSEIPNLRSGGVENVTFRLAIGFRQNGHNVYCINLDNKLSYIDRLPFEFINIERNYNCCDSILKYINDNSIDIIINQSPLYLWKHILKYIKPQTPNITFIKVLHTDPTYYIKGVFDKEPLYISGNKISRLLYRISPITQIRKHRRKLYLQSLYCEWIDFYDHVVVLSNKVINDFKNLAKKPDCTNISAISNPIDFSYIDINKKREKIILYVGRMHREAKRPDRLIHIWEKLHDFYTDWKLICIGDGPMLSDLESYCIKKKIKNIYFIGQTNPVPYYDKASVLCLTSTTEGFGLVCGEALAHGVIPIAFNSFGAVRDLITDNYNGLLIEPFNLNDYALKLAKIMSNQSYADHLRKNIINNRDFHFNYKIENILKQWDNLFVRIRNNN